jgi:predicted RNase H-like HicB family nuclease
MNRKANLAVAFLALTSSIVVSGSIAQEFLAPKGIQSLDETDININYEIDLSCSACIRGGYFYCGNTNQFDGSCCEFKNASCWTQSLDKCMNTIWNQDEFNSLFNFCGNLQAKSTCGTSKILINGLGNSSDLSINLKYGESCTYQIVSHCGFPRIEVNRTDLDVVVASFPKFSDIKFSDPSFDLKQFGKDFTRALSNAKDAINGKLEYTFGKGT